MPDKPTTPPVTTSPTPLPTPQSQPQPTPTVNWEDAKSKIEDIENYLRPFGGQPGHNPFIWATKHLHPLKARLNKGERTAALWEAIKGLKKEPPIVDIKVSTAPVEVKVEPTNPPQQQEG